MDGRVALAAMFAAFESANCLAAIKDKPVCQIHLVREKMDHGMRKTDIIGSIITYQSPTAPPPRMLTSGSASMVSLGFWLDSSTSIYFPRKYNNHFYDEFERLDGRGFVLAENRQLPSEHFEQSCPEPVAAE
jgi:hypothetical protein